MADYYKILGIDKNASAEEVKRAYRKLAHEYHPDKQGGNEAKFKEINEAYQVLSDPKKREQYDQFGSSAFQGGQGFGGFGQGGYDFGGFNFDRDGFDINDIFEMFGGAFGGRSTRRSPEETSRGGDIEISLNVDFYTGARGGVQKIEINKDSVCEECAARDAL